MDKLNKDALNHYVNDIDLANEVEWIQEASSQINTLMQKINKSKKENRNLPGFYIKHLESMVKNVRHTIGTLHHIGLRKFKCRLLNIWFDKEFNTKEDIELINEFVEKLSAVKNDQTSLSA